MEPSDLTPEQIEQRIEADVQRVAKIARGMLRNLYENPSEGLEGQVNGPSARLDTFVIAGIWTWEDEDGDELEDVVMGSETRKHHVRQGILDCALAYQRQRPDADN